MNRVLITGCQAAAYAVKSANVDVVSAYPITPQTGIVETIANMIEDGEMQCRFLAVEGEHSAMTACAGAIAGGARVFTATSSAGLLYMHEPLHMVGCGRLPMVLTNVNRALFPPWALLVDHQDSLSQRDTGWLQLYAASVQEIYNAIIQSYYVAEKAQLPVMVNFDGFILSHSASSINLPEQDVIDAFLPPYEPEWFLDPANPSSFANVTLTREYADYRATLQPAQEAAKGIIKEAAARYRDLTGLWDGDMIECYRTDDAEFILVTMGTMGAEAKLSVNALRDQNVKAGSIRIRFYRPFPAEALRESIPDGARVVVVDRNYAFGMNSGIVECELKASLFGYKDAKVSGRVLGIGGEDVTWQLLAEELMKGEI